MNRTAVIGMVCLLLFALLLFSFTQFVQTTNTNIKSEISISQSVKTGLDFNITNVTLSRSYINQVMMFNISFDVLNPFNQTVVITSSDTCTPFTAYAYIFPVNASPYGFRSWWPYLCGQMITYLNINPGLSHHSSEFFFNTSSLPDGEFYLQPILRGYISNPLNTPYYTSTMQVTIENNSIVNMKNYVSNPSLYDNAFVLIRNVFIMNIPKIAPPALQNYSNYLEFNVVFDILTLNGQNIYSRSLNESIYFHLKLENLDLHTFGPFIANYSVQSTGSRFGIPAEYTGTYGFDLNSTINNNYNMSQIPNGNYSLHLIEETGLIMDNNSNYATFELMNDQISNIQYTNFSISFPPEQLTNPAPSSTNPISSTADTSSSTTQISTISDSSSFTDSTATTSSNQTSDGFSYIIPIVTICFVIIVKKKRS